MALKSIEIILAADGAGNATIDTGLITGYLHSIVYKANNYGGAVDFTITTVRTGETVWTEANVGASKTCLPRLATHNNVGVAALYAASGTAVNDRMVIARDQLRIAIAQAVAGSSGTFVVAYDDGK